MSIFNAYRTHGMTTDPAEDWRIKAACREYDPDRWHPIGEGDKYNLAEAKALEICAQCPVRPQCSSWAVENGIVYGVWGMPQDQLRQRVKAAGWAIPKAPRRQGLCVRGHVLDAQNLRVEPDGQRRCRVCARDANVRAKERQATRKARA